MNTMKSPLRASVSTWALHPLLGTVAAGRPGDPDARLMAHRLGTLDLLDVPEQLAAHGFHTMELCHFHIPDTSQAYLEELRGRCETHGVELWSLLIDDADISDPIHSDRDRDWVAVWIDRASLLGPLRKRSPDPSFSCVPCLSRAMSAESVSSRKTGTTCSRHPKTSPW